MLKRKMNTKIEQVIGSNTIIYINDEEHKRLVVRVDEHPTKYRIFINGVSFLTDKKYFGKFPSWSLDYRVWRENYFYEKYPSLKEDDWASVIAVVYETIDRLGGSWKYTERLKDGKWRYISMINY